MTMELLNQKELFEQPQFTASLQYIGTFATASQALS